MFKPVLFAVMIKGKVAVMIKGMVDTQSVAFGSSQVEEKKVSEKTLQTPLLPSPVADHVKCNILKAQLENASRVSAQVCGAHASL